MSKIKTAFFVDESLLYLAKEHLKNIKGARLEGISCIGSNDARLWYKDENNKLLCMLIPIKNNENN